MSYTYHAEVERRERLEALEQILGMAETRIVLEVVIDNTRKCLTSSGIIIVKDLHTEVIITAYMATHKQCMRLYYTCGKRRMPEKIHKRIIRNAERHPELFNI